MKRTFEIMPRNPEAKGLGFQSSIYEPKAAHHNLICEVYRTEEAEYIKACLNANEDIYADYAAERIRADELWDIAHALHAALSRLLDSQRGLNLAEWQAATAQGREALAKADAAEPEPTS